MWVKRLKYMLLLNWFKWQKEKYDFFPQNEFVMKQRIKEYLMNKNKLLIEKADSKEANEMLSDKEKNEFIKSLKDEVNR